MADLMGLQLSAARRLLEAGALLAATALVLRIGGRGSEILPAAPASLALLALLLVCRRTLEYIATHGRSAAVVRARAWAADHRFWIGLGLATLLAALVRFAGIGRDLGHVALGIDENRLNQSVLHLFRTGGIDHRTVEHYPGVHYWMLVGTYLLAYVRGLMNGLGPSLARMPAEQFVAAGRVVSAVQSTATVMITGLLGRRLAGPRTGLLAAALMAVAPLSISLGRQLRNDAALTLLVAAAVYFALGTHRKAHHDWEPALAGALAGLAAGVKYTGVFVLLPVLLAAVSCEDRRRRARATGLAVAGFLAAALISNHFVWADIPNLVDQLSDQITITREGHWAAQDNPAAYHARILAERVVGWPLLLLAAAAAVVNLARGRWRWWLLLTYPLSYIWFVAQRPSQLPRWVYPAAPFTAIAACGALVVLLDLSEAALKRRTYVPRWRWMAGPALVLGLFAPMLLATGADLDRRLSLPTYALAESWLEQNATPGDGVLIQYYWLQLDPQRHRLHRVDSLEEVLDGGLYELAANDWIVVQEELLGHDALSRLRRAARIAVDPSLGGNQGPDFAIYAAPTLEPVGSAIEVDLAERGARDYLGHEWPAAAEAGRGLVLPDDGARLFLPPLGGRARSLQISLATDSLDGAAPAVDVYSGDRLLEQAPVPATTPANATRSVRVELSIATVGPRVVELLVRPREGGPVHVLGFRLD